MSKRQPWRQTLVPDRRTALVAGYAALTLGSILLWDAYEARGKARPFLTKFLPGA